MKTRLAIRGFQNGVPVFEEHVNAEDVDLALLAEKHALRLKGELHLVEIEFLDEPDPLQRFFRIGTDPSGMVKPVRIDLEDCNA